MNGEGLPPADTRRLSDFRLALRETAALWLPQWAAGEDDGDFGTALLEIAARFNAEVAERLASYGGKASLGFLDWLGFTGAAAEPARMPAVFTLSETAADPEFMPSPARFQTGAADVTVSFETEQDLNIAPGRLAAVFAADPGKGSYFSPPPGLSALDPPDGLPDQWWLKSIPAARSDTLQLEPSLGLSAGMVIALEQRQYRITSVDGGLVSVEPSLPAGLSVAGRASVRKVTRFVPFRDGGAADEQEHAVYLGDSALFDLSSGAKLIPEPSLLLGRDYEWHYWGKALGDDDSAPPRWVEIGHAMRDPSHLALDKLAGDVIPLAIAGRESRWLRIRRRNGLKPETPLDLRRIQVAVDKEPEPSHTEVAVAAKKKPSAAVEAFSNTTPAPTSSFYPLGREPRMFDAFYLGSGEVFSKRDATATISFTLADGALQHLQTFDLGAAGTIVASLDRARALHVFTGTGDGEFREVSPFPGVSPDAGPAPGAVQAPDQGAGFGELAQLAGWQSGLGTCIAMAAGNVIHKWSSGAGWSRLPDLPDKAAPFDGLVAVAGPNQSVLLVVLRDKALFALPIPGDETISDDAKWQSLGNAVEGIFAILPIRTLSGNPPEGKLIALTAEDKSARADLHILSIDARAAASAAATAGPALTGIARNVLPRAVVADNNISIIAAQSEHRLIRHREGAAPVELVIGDDARIVGPGLDAGLDGAGNLLAACLVSRGGSATGTLYWYPDMPDYVELSFEDGPESFPKEPAGSPVIAANHVLRAASQSSRLLRARIGEVARTGLEDDDVVSAVQLPRSISLEVNAELVVVNGDHGLVVERASVADARGIQAIGSAGTERLWRLKERLSGHQGRRSVFHLGPGIRGKLKAPDKLRLESSAASDIKDGDVLLVRTHSADLTAHRVTRNGNPATFLLDPETAGQDGDTVRCWIAETQTATVHPSIVLPRAPVDLSSALVKRKGLVQAGAVGRFTMIAQGEGANDTAWAVFDAEHPSPEPGELFVNALTADWTIPRAEERPAPALSWEYWNGSGWWALKVEDRTNNLLNTGQVRFDVPSDMAASDWSGRTNYWIRARLVGGDYGKEEVTVESWTENGKTSQKIIRRTDGLQPPIVLRVAVTYKSKPVLPRYLITMDSGSERDQSEANRTGAAVALFTPLRASLAERESGPVRMAAAGADPCCGGIGDPQQSAQDMPGTDLGRALYLGFTKPFKGSGFTLFASVRPEDEASNGMLLRADVLSGGRFHPCLISDRTRALGETGLLTLDIPVAPTVEELFGKQLCWIRIRPEGKGDNWAPVLSGLYPNAAWAVSGETMTRELVASPSGAPGMTAVLARPPLFAASLDLRVREELGEEELNALRSRDAGAVNCDVENLPGCWVRWTEVPDTSDCGPYDRVYSLDETAGTIRFGDGVRGAIPPASADGIVAFSYRHYDMGAGSDMAANAVPARTPLTMVTPVENIESVIAAGRAAGGRPWSSGRTAEFAPVDMRARGRAVSADDAGKLLRKRFPGLAQVRFIQRRTRPLLVAVTGEPSLSPDQALQREIRHYLEQAAIPALAAAEIRGPARVNVAVSLQLGIGRLEDAENVTRLVTARLLALFDPRDGGLSGGGWPLGRSPVEAEIRAALDGIPHLRSVEAKLAAAADATSPLPPALGAGELAVLDPLDVRIGFSMGRAT